MKLLQVPTKFFHLQSFFSTSTLNSHLIAPRATLHVVRAVILLLECKMFPMSHNPANRFLGLSVNRDPNLFFYMVKVYRDSHPPGWRVPLEFQLSDFCIYRAGPEGGQEQSRREICGIQDLGTKEGCETLFFDGTFYAPDLSSLENPWLLHCLKNMKFNKSTVRISDKQRTHFMEPRICLEFDQPNKDDSSYDDIQYWLDTPSPSYSRFYQPFLWIAEFGRHVTHFMLQYEEHPDEPNKFPTLGTFRGGL
jgi:hypothetical protein